VTDDRGRPAAGSRRRSISRLHAQPPEEAARTVRGGEANVRKRVQAKLGEVRLNDAIPQPGGWLGRS
jgi:hypothetical protein